VFSQRASYKPTRNLRVRPVPEMRMCFVFTPAAPKLYTLNMSAWLVLTLCDGRSGRDLVDAYATEMAAHLPRDDALREVRAAIGDLEGKGMIVRADKRARAQQKGSH